MIEFHQLDPVDVQIVGASSDELKALKKRCSFPAVAYVQKRFGKERKEWDKTLIWTSKREIYMPAGLLHRATAYCDSKGIEYRVVRGNGVLPLPAPQPPHLPGIDLREDQTQMIEAACRLQRGVLKAPTGTGKTVVMIGLISCFPTCTSLILVHNKTILGQTIRELNRFGIDARQVGDGETSFDGQMVVATRQTMVKHLDHEWLGKVDIVFVDECHLFGGMNGQYAKIMRALIAPMRIGFTATMPKDRESAIGLEAVMGPIVDEVTYDEAQEKELLATPKVVLEPVPINSRIEQISRQRNAYNHTYKVAIVENRQRNVRIMRWVRKLNEEGRTVIVFVKELPHGEELLTIAADMEIDAHFVQGSTETKIRRQLELMLADGSAKCVISSSVWREGLNIPSLGGVIFAGGGKSETSLLQAIGRALRRTDTKSDALIIDFLDPYRYMAEHAIERIITLQKLGWL